MNTHVERRRVAAFALTGAASLAMSACMRREVAGAAGPAGFDAGRSSEGAPAAADRPAASTVVADVAAAVDAPSAAEEPKLGPHSSADRRTTSFDLSGVTETWRLEWIRPPFPACRGEEGKTCACAGFAPGERGDLDLVRSRPGAPDERLSLSKFFDDGEARLVDAPDAGALQVLAIGDYDHDGRASELVLQTGAGPCGHTDSIVIGVSTANPKLHAFASAEEPSKPLTLDQVSQWETLRTKGDFEAVQIACGDHGADESTSVSVRAAGGVLHASSKTAACPP